VKTQTCQICFNRPKNPTLSGCAAFAMGASVGQAAARAAIACW
jgi:hypothetical protein